MTITSISIYCLPNIRAPWVLVYEPHPWNHGALRVKQESAVLIYQRVPTAYEQAWCRDFVRHTCRTFTKVEDLLDYEDGQHENVAEVREALEIYKSRIDAVLAEVARKQEEKRKKEAKRRKPLAMVSDPKPEESEDEDEDNALVPPY